MVAKDVPALPEKPVQPISSIKTNWNVLFNDNIH